MRILTALCLCCIPALLCGCSGDSGRPDDEVQPGTVSEKLASPVLVAGEATETSLSLSWEAVEHADGYVWKVNEGEENTTDSTGLTATGLSPAMLYTVSVKAVSTDPAYEDSPWASLNLLTASGPGEFSFSFRTTGSELYCKVTPEDMETPYYFYFMTKENWDSFPSPQQVVESRIEEVKSLAADLGTTYPEILSEETITYTGESEIVFSRAVYDTEYIVYAFTWDYDGTTGEIVWQPFSKEFPGTSGTGTVDIQFSDPSPTTLHTVCTPDAQTEWYYQVLLDSEQAGAELERVGETAFIKELLAVQQSGILQGTVEEDWINLEPGTRYTLYTVGFDHNGNIFLCSAESTTTVHLIDSRLFEELPGEWQGVQTFEDGDGVRTRSSFTMTISTSEGDHDYRMWNQLICKIDGYTAFPEYGTEGIPYRSPADLMDNGFDEDAAYRAFGPKLILTVNELDQIRIETSAGGTFYGWSELGDVYMMGADSGYNRFDGPLTVLYNSSGPLLTVRCDDSGFYPSLFTQTSTGWMLHCLGVSDIMLYKLR